MYNNSLVYGPKAIFIFNMKDLGPSANGCDNFIIYGILVIYGYLEKKKIFAKEPEWVSRGMYFFRYKLYIFKNNLKVASKMCHTLYIIIIIIYGVIIFYNCVNFFVTVGPVCIA